ncbi:MAG: type II toxin-antitoxin system HicB family antitoxin [Clostridia bacterium]|nr:type II toxin-antitoxin system HicB family antitoxin [Clostridia bacterium]
MKNAYVYPAIFNYADDGISISFPDLPGCLSEAQTTEEALKNAEEVLGLWMYNLEEDNEKIPKPTKLEDVCCQKNEKVLLIKTWMPLVRMEVEEQSVKKTLTIPQWLNKIAEENNVNFSKILQAALKEYLNVSEPTK